MLWRGDLSRSHSREWQNWGFPLAQRPPHPSMVFWVQVLCFSSQHPTPSRGNQQGFPEWDRSLYPSRLGKASQVDGQAGAFQSHPSRGAGMSSNHPGHSSAGLGTAPALALALGSLAWGHREKDPAYSRGRARSMRPIVYMLGLTLPLTHW